MVAERHGYSPSLDDKRSRASSQSRGLGTRENDVPAAGEVQREMTNSGRSGVAASSASFKGSG